MNTKFFMIIGSIIIIAAIITVIGLLFRRRRELPPLTLRIVLWVRSMIRHTYLCVKQRALRQLYRKRLSKAFAELAAEKQPIKLSDLESDFSEGVVTVAPEEEEEKELLVLMN